MCDHFSVSTTTVCCDALKIMFPVGTHWMKKRKSVTLNDIQQTTIMSNYFGVSHFSSINIKHLFVISGSKRGVSGFGSVGQGKRFEVTRD